MSQHKVVLLLGSNLGKRKEYIDQALQLIGQNIGKIEKKTEILESMPVEYDSYKIFCNIAVTINTDFSPIKLLEKLKEIERKMGRTKDSVEIGGYIDRVMDIDIIYYNSLNFCSNKLKIPHIKHIKERDFSIKLLIALKDKH